MIVTQKELVNPGTFEQRKLSLHLKGANVNVKLVNCIRRISKLYVPTYGFYNFEFIENTSIFNNDMMKLRLMHLTPQNIKTDLFYLDPRYYENVSWDNKFREKHPDDKLNYEFIIDVKNNISKSYSMHDYINITTNDMKFYLNGKIIDPGFKNPLLIIQLRKDQSFICKGKAVLGVGLGTGPGLIDGECWAASGNSYFKQISDSEFILTIESKGQMHEYDILDKSCKYALMKLDFMKSLISSKKNEKNNTRIIFTMDEDESVNAVVNYHLQSMNEVKYAACTRKVDVNYSTTLELETEKGENPITCFLKAIELTRKDIEELKTKIAKARKS